ncbi:hypothetical protein VOLCADRAFT_84514 [Volvox carteri f. nagariensis]|uniref:Peroxisome biogenesis protein 22 n=1 Tax=Volvox carteri f. nagariensis TaxID=3068 RepID=D8UIW6_VOLCA|nr:uncharacterized protein VOLCADRAFT_84514 [Volvox carteri f. nagariensis]EFJ40327.1 hypothetical protein VOLCADRAFT_84514 [Volvox carteri f. nagariensis]|eukprot:XP_002958590.1 hypothetical protein VOLCADRAFT_84514 [Volvox carteri f. nagariensis]
MSFSQVIAAVYNRVVQLLSTAPKGALSVTGILGLALLVYGYLQLRGNDNRAEDQRREQHRARVRATAGPDAAVDAPRPAATPPAPVTQAPSACASATPLGRAVAAQLSGVKRVTLSLPGVVFLERTPAQLQESATVCPKALEVLQEISRVSDVYLIAHVEDDVGEAVVTGALEAAGVLGNGPGQVKQHHVLCCSSLDGKVPIARQLEPELHVDGHPASVDELKRFLPRLLLVREGAPGGAGSSQVNVSVAASLTEYFGM